MDRAANGRGADGPPPGNLEASATCCNYINYTTRLMKCGEGHVVVLTGKLPRAPKTRSGESVMRAGEIRYFSITHYLLFHSDFYADQVFPLTCYGSLMDDEIITGDQGPGKDWYIIAYSRPEDRPSNATAASGVTWQNWGPSHSQSITVRRLSVMPEWHSPKWAPDGNNMPWPKTA